jgi:hypothetical protein
MLLKNYLLTKVEFYIVQYKKNACRGFGFIHLYLYLLLSKISEFNNITNFPVVINN